MCRIVCVHFNQNGGKDKKHFVLKTTGAISWSNRETITQQVRGNWHKRELIKSGWMQRCSPASAPLHRPGCWHTDVPGTGGIMMLLRNAR